MSKIVVAIPAHNEEKTIGTVVARTIKALSNEPSYTVMVVADSCADRTAEVARETGALVFEKNSGRGLANTFRLEMQKALELNPEIIVHIDADGQYLSYEIPKLIREVRAGYDLVLGSRITGYIEHMSFSRKYLNKLAAKIFSMLGKQKIDDMTTGFRAFTPEIAKFPIISNFTYTHEQIVRAYKGGYKIKYVPISFLARDGKSRLEKGAKDYMKKSLRELLKLQLKVGLIK
jgi:glycosyltransferase involved in cell wall biosynthesis